MVLLGLAESIHYCIRDREEPGRCGEEDDCSAALVPRYPGIQVKIRHTHPYQYDVLVSHCGTFDQVDKAAHNFVAHDTGLIGNKGPAGSSDLYQMVQVPSAVRLDFGLHCEGVVLVPPVGSWRAPTFHPCAVAPCLRTAYCRHRRSVLDLAKPHYIRKIHPTPHRCFGNAAEAPIEDCH